MRFPGKPMSNSLPTGERTSARLGQHHALYVSTRWAQPTHGLRARVLIRDHYTCIACGRVEHSSRLHAHHVVPHKGNPELFYDINNVTTLCEDCHNIGMRQAEVIGYSLALGPDGLPVDKNHPFYK